MHHTNPRSAGRLGVKIDDHIHAMIKMHRGKLTLADQGVLWMIRRFVNHDTGQTWVSFARLGAECGLSDKRAHRTITGHVDRLVALGICELAPRVNGRSQYIRFPLHPSLTDDCPQPGRERVPVDYPQPGRLPVVTGTVTRRNRDAKPSPNPYNPIEPAPRCHRCDERHNVEARCPALAAAR
jgi:hypothetical protein